MTALLARVRWGNVSRLVALAAAGLLIVGAERGCEGGGPVPAARSPQGGARGGGRVVEAGPRRAREPQGTAATRGRARSKVLGKRLRLEESARRRRGAERRRSAGRQRAAGPGRGGAPNRTAGPRRER